MRKAEPSKYTAWVRMIWPSGSANQVPEAALAFLIKKKGRNLLKINPKIPIYSLLKIFVKGLFLGIANAT